MFRNYQLPRKDSRAACNLVIWQWSKHACTSDLSLSRRMALELIFFPWKECKKICAFKVACADNHLQVTSAFCHTTAWGRCSHPTNVSCHLYVFLIYCAVSLLTTVYKISAFVPLRARVCVCVCVDVRRT